MSIEHLLAVVRVTDLAAANSWYEKLFGRHADNNPMPSLVEWQVVDHAWVQVFVDVDRAGSSLLNLAVDDIDTHIAELADRGIHAGEVQTVTKGVQLSNISDPDGNAITLIGRFRVAY
ncbi:glyoxalase [Williamsia sp. Leaf354]|jgi:predicted enzyme related to lactoylglutathione lyase|uniref:VOC family protein n=1 Tax=Williamsia sp. Leaf354 TaxID=1736349 RepID=UPI0006FC88B1|nr:VOC family protein [Williamsia sp. Leaf354]KQR96482.1 glyoxalase [Williamsia sp. Leaf354]